MRILPRQHSELFKLKRFQHIELHTRLSDTDPRVPFGLPYTDEYTLETGYVSFSEPEGVAARILVITKMSFTSETKFYLELDDVRVYAYRIL